MEKFSTNSTNDIKFRKSSSVSKGRLLILATLLIVLCIAALGIGLGIVLTRKIDDSVTKNVGEDGTESGQGVTQPGLGGTTSPPYRTTAPPYRTSDSLEGRYRFAAVASDASQTCPKIGTDILARKGGSAIDAAIASLLCQCVQNAHSCGIGGGHFMTVYNRQNRTSYTIMAREMAPGSASEEMYVPDNASSVEGGLAVGIPGEIKGLHLAWTIGGTLPWEELFKPTIDLLLKGWPVTEPLASAIQTTSRRGFFDRNQNLRDLFYNPITNDFYKEGEIIKMPKLAQTFQRIAYEGPDAFYNGSLTDDIVSDIQEAVGGIITKEDLNRYVAVRKDPLMIQLKDESKVYSPPPPSSGAVYEMILNIVDEYGFSSDSVSSQTKSITTWHRIVEAMKFAYAKRSSLGDGDAEDNDFKMKLDQIITNMTSEDFAQYVISQIDDQRTFGTMYYGPTFYDQTGTGTAHLSVLAANGDAVSVTSTINLYFGSKVVGPRTGIIFNNEMDDFSTPNTKNSFGVPASAANFIKPYKRPLSSMCPSIVVSKDGHVKLVVGASGGTKITTSTALITIETLWFGWGIKRAIDSSRIHHQLLPPYITIENGFDQGIIDGLDNIGHNISMASSAGSVVQGILQLTEGSITANSDFRKNGHTDGY
ncbi:hypothetical protein FSP39_008991 [Pinctada imbricata]|uniref:Uncharacterized protein n=1 Tax=Pinctada imbricata TaxID=66713 RepID=A0AA88XJP6_PINIB|nr:hypothetical protein FSP39_008991 [Pinctada imbricata]